MTRLDRHIRFTLKLSFEARTDSVAFGDDLDAMLAHVAAQKLARMTPDEFVKQVCIVTDRPAPIAPFVRRRSRHLVLQRDRLSGRPVYQRLEGTEERTADPHSKSPPAGTDSRRSISQSPTTPRRWSA